MKHFVISISNKNTSSYNYIIFCLGRFSYVAKLLYSHFLLVLLYSLSSDSETELSFKDFTT